ncbi:MAG: DUF2096 family protein [Nitrososphaerota archaeon]|jgi:hypothetical protein|nr:DUF2096 family protein [Nitrososphaerota archaeon]
MTVWKILEDLLMVLLKKDVPISANIFEDLRAARSMIELLHSTDASEDVVAKAEAYTTNVEAYLIDQAQMVFEPNIVNEWLKYLKEANSQQVIKEETAAMTEGRFVVGVPRDQQWIRIETDNKLPEEYVLKLAEKWHLTVNKQDYKHLVIHGQLGDVKAFVKQIAAQLA